MPKRNLAAMSEEVTLPSSEQPPAPDHLSSLPHELLLLLFQQFLSRTDQNQLRLVSKKLKYFAELSLKWPQRKKRLEQSFGKRAVVPYHHHVDIAEDKLPFELESVAHRVLALVYCTTDDEEDSSQFYLPWGESVKYDDELINIYYGYHFLRSLDELPPGIIVDRIIRLWKDNCLSRGMTEDLSQKTITSNIKKSGSFRQTLLHLFALTGDPAAIMTLIKAGADVNQPDVWGNTPLILLFTPDPMYGNRIPPSIALLEFLHENKAQFNILNISQNTLYDEWDIRAEGTSGTVYPRAYLFPTYPYRDQFLNAYEVAFAFLLAKEYMTNLPPHFMTSPECATALACLYARGYIVQNEYEKTISACLAILKPSLPEKPELKTVLAYITSFSFLRSKNKMTQSDYDKFSIEYTQTLSTMFEMPPSLVPYLPSTRNRRLFFNMANFSDALSSYPPDTHTERASEKLAILKNKI